MPDAMPDAYGRRGSASPAGLAGRAGGRRRSGAARQRLLPKGERVEIVDRARAARVRVAVLDGRPARRGAVRHARAAACPSRDWLIAQLGGSRAAAPIELLAGRPAAPQPDRGPIVCVCFDVGMKTIVEAIASQRLTSVEAVGEALSAGTNCGSCRPAIRRLIGDNQGGVPMR